MESITDKRAVFAGCAKNCAVTLPWVLKNVERIAKLFAESAFIFEENDSRDETKSQLRDWCNSHPHARLITHDGLDASCRIRTIRLAKLRSEYIALVKADYNDYDYLFVVDLDEVNAAKIDLEAVGRAIEFLAHDTARAAVFANSAGTYYDMWALRHPKLCPGDVWEEVLDYVVRFNVSDQEAFSQTFAKRCFKLEQGAPLEVDSAFGGLAIYKIGSILKNQAGFVGYKTKLLPAQKGPTKVGLQICEHVSFHAGFRAIGQTLFIHPDLINVRSGDVGFPSSWFRQTIFDIQLAE